MNLNLQKEKIFFYSEKNLREILPDYYSSERYEIENCPEMKKGSELTGYLDSLNYRIIIIEYSVVKYSVPESKFFRWIKKTDKRIVLFIHSSDLKIMFENNVSVQNFVVLPVETSAVYRFVQKSGCNNGNEMIPAGSGLENKNVKMLSSFFPEKLNSLYGNSTAVYHLKQKIMEVAPSDLSVMLLGENGTGKTYTARLIHELSERKNCRFVVVNVAEISETLVEAALFGTVDGAFTDAKNMPGYFDEADGGTLFLDEIGELSLSLQAKLLRVLETGKYRAVGSVKEKSCNIRFLCATNKNLKEMCRNGSFRIDLYYRIADFELYIEPLRNRQADILLFAEQFLSHTGKVLSSEAVKKIEAYDWPGNIRQLNKCMKRARVLSREEEITEDEIIF